jgi:hypothetical protein
MATGTKGGYITALVYRSRYVKRKCNGGEYKPFKEMIREDILEGFVKSLKRQFGDDPDQKWINTYKTGNFDLRPGLLRFVCMSSIWDILEKGKCRCSNDLHYSRCSVAHGIILSVAVGLCWPRYLNSSGNICSRFRGSGVCNTK